MSKRRTLVVLSTTFLLLSEHSQVLTFFGPGFTFQFDILENVTQVLKEFWKVFRPKCKPNKLNLVIAKLQLKLQIACIF